MSFSTSFATFATSFATFTAAPPKVANEVAKVANRIFEKKILWKGIFKNNEKDGSIFKKIILQMGIFKKIPKYLVYWFLYICISEILVHINKTLY